MKKRMLFLLPVVAVALLVNSCGKTYSPDPVYDISQKRLLFSGLRPEFQTFYVPAGTLSTIKGAEGTALNFYPNSFKDAMGNIITSGTVKVDLVEMYKPGAMISNMASTMCGALILKSGGQIDIKASVNGTPVFANKYGVGFQQPAPSYECMGLFYGQNNNVDSVTNWENAGDSTKAGTTTCATVFTGGGNQYLFDSCTNFGLTNCDRFWGNDSPVTSVSVTLPDNTFNPGNTQIYLVLPESNSVMCSNAGYGGATFNSKTKTMNLISEGQADIVPVTTTYKLVVMAKKDKQFYYYETNGNVTRKMVKNAILAKKTEAEVKALLNNL